MSELKRLFGLRVKELRIKSGLKQEQLAERIDIAVRNLSKIETGITFPSTETLEKIIEVLRVTPKDLFDFEHSKRIKTSIDEIFYCRPELNSKHDSDLKSRLGLPTQQHKTGYALNSTRYDNHLNEIVADLESNIDKIPDIYKIVKVLI